MKYSHMCLDCGEAAVPLGQLHIGSVGVSYCTVYTMYSSAQSLPMVCLACRQGMEHSHMCLDCGEAAVSLGQLHIGSVGVSN